LALTRWTNLALTADSRRALRQKLPPLKAWILPVNTAYRAPKRERRAPWWHELCIGELTGYSLSTKVNMLVTLVAVLCNSQLCMEKIVTTSEQSGITMTACQVNAQIGIAEWLTKGPYHDWRLQSYKCVMGKYIPKNEA